MHLPHPTDEDLDIWYDYDEVRGTLRRKRCKCVCSIIPRPRGRRETAWYRLLAHVCSFPEKPGIRLRLEIVGKINTYTSGIFPYH